MLPNFLLIGPGRAGSDWITKNLMLHPQIYMPRQKVTRFFIDEYDRGIDWYKAIFGSRKESAVGEATVGYLHNERSPELIHKHLPDIKLIANLRDPVDRAYSSYSRLQGMARKGDVNYQISFEEKIRMTPRLLAQGLYARHLKRWFRLFPRKNFLILTFDEMNNNPALFLQSIYEFLGVDASFQSSLTDQKLNASASINSKSRVLYFAYRALLRMNLFKLARFVDTVNRTQRQRIRPDTRERLINEIFLEDIIELESMLGRDLSGWKAL